MAVTITPPITAAERDRWQLDAGNVPIGPDEREIWRRDPTAFYAIERLHDASDELREAMEDSVNETGLRLHGEALSERLSGARERLERAERKWATALAYADELLSERGGE